MKRRLNRFLVFGGVAVFLLSAVHRLWFEFRPIPIQIPVARPATQQEIATWEKYQHRPSPDSMKTCYDQLPYPDPRGIVKLAKCDLLKIRAMASWNSWMPYRQDRISVVNSTNVSLTVYERHCPWIDFNKDSSGWHMNPVGGQIDWISEKDIPIFSFH